MSLPTEPFARLAIPVLLVVLVVAACAPTSGALGTPATPPPTGNPSVEVPTDDATPDLASPSASPAQSAGPSTSPDASASTSSSPDATTEPTADATAAPTTTPKPPNGSGDRTIVRAYFFLGSFTDNAGLAPVLREVPPTLAVATAAVEQLLRGPNDAEMGARPAMSTDIPARTKLLGLSIDGKTATVDLSKEFEAGGDRGSIIVQPTGQRVS